jgi:hypothetical protein
LPGNGREPTRAREFDYHGPGLGKGGIARLFLDGEQVGEGTVGATAAMIFSADDTCDVGKEGGALVAEDYPLPNDFTGQVNWVRDRHRRRRRRRRSPPPSRRVAPRRDGAAVARSISTAGREIEMAASGRRSIPSPRFV